MNLRTKDKKLNASENGLLEVAWYLAKYGKKSLLKLWMLIHGKQQYHYFIQHLVQVRRELNFITV